MRNGITRYIDGTGLEIPATLSDRYPIPTTKNEHTRRFSGMMRKIGLGAPGQTNPSDGVTDIDPATWETNYLSIHKNYISAMDSFNQKQWVYTTTNGVQQWTGCSPTAGSNIMAFWAANGFPTLNPTGKQTDIAMALRTEMGTTQSSDGTGTTNPWNIDDGLQSYARKNGRTNAIAVNDNFSDFSTVVTEVDAGRPSLQSYWSQSYFEDHTVTVVGYKEFVRNWYESNSYYVVVRNNWSTDTAWNLYVKWGTWNSNVVTTFRS